MKSRSLSQKLALFYIISVLIIVAVSFAFAHYYNVKRANELAASSLETGIGYLNGNTSGTVVNPPDVSKISVDQVLSSFSRLTGYSAQTVLESGSIPAWTEITDLQTHDVFRIYRNDFPRTIVYPGSDRMIFVNRTIDNRTDVIIVATLDSQTWMNIQNERFYYNNSFAVLPFILIFTALFAVIVSRYTVTPLKLVMKAAQHISGADLTERVHITSNDEIGSLAASFNSMADRLEAAFAKQKQFVSDAAHELRTPLASLKTSVTKAMSSRRSEEEYQQVLGFILNRVNTLEDLVNDLLFLALVDEGRLGNGETEFDLSPIISETADSFKDLFEEKGIVFTFTIDPDLKVRGTPKLHMRVLSNLLDNAYKYTLPGGSVDMQAAKDSSGVQITISDTGWGMSEEQQAHVFDRFYKSDEVASSEKGFGLGLSIAKSIVTAFGGEIKVGSELGKGSVFTIMYDRGT